MGFGDVKLALGIGWLVGISGSIAVFLLSFWIGAVVGLLLMASYKAEMKSQIPFAPFLLVAYFIVSVWGVNLSTLFPIW
jgi:leader peptidase (prepilin peptidase)/N-methyltransferase